MSVENWQRELLATLSELRSGQTQIVERLDSMRDDLQHFTRIIARRFGTTGSQEPLIGDHVVYHLRPGQYLPAVIVAVAGPRKLDLEVFGLDPTHVAERFPRAVAPGFEPGTWHFPGEAQPENGR